MDRVIIGNGRWFDRSTARVFIEATSWDGRNHISMATGSQWDHQQLYLTTSGTWILHAWSAWQGTRASWEVIDASQAHAWLISQGHTDAVPADALASAEV